MWPGIVEGASDQATVGYTVWDGDTMGDCGKSARWNHVAVVEKKEMWSGGEKARRHAYLVFHVLASTV